MKKVIVFAVCLFFGFAGNAQDKVFSTKSGTVKFFSNSPLEKIEAVNSQVTSKLSTNGQLVFMMLIKGFKFDNSLMEDHFNENYMESSKYKQATFKGTVANIASVNFTKDGSYNDTVNGDLTIHGVTKKIAEKGTVTVKGGKPSINSKFFIKIKEYGIKGEYIGDKIANEVEITVACNLQ